MNSFVRNYLVILFLFLSSQMVAQVQPKEHWWLDEPFRLIQTNLREIDAIDFDLDVYVNSIRETGANIVLINVGGIVANYYTDLDYQFQNPNLRFDMIREVTERLHEEGIRVIGRFDFSKLNEQLAAQKPEWLYKNLGHETVNYNGQVHTCVNGGYQQEYSLAILKEALTRFPLDGVFFNMIGYQTRDYSNHYHGICQSDACRERFKNWSGGMDLPVREDTGDPVFRKYQQFKSETSNELFFRIQDLIKSFGNHIAISTYTHAGTDFFRKESNSHAALYDDFVPWEYQSGHNVKSAVGSWENKQVSNAAVHFYGYPARHAADARWLTQQRLFQNIMYGAGPDFYCIGRLDNLEDRTVLQNVKNVFRFHEKNEKYLHHTVSGNEVLVLHDGQSGNEYSGLFEMLTENHILFDVMEHWCIDSENVPKEIESYRVIVLPEISRLSKLQCEKLDAYVAGGGKLLVTGFTSTKDENGTPLDQIRLNALGVEKNYTSFEKEQGIYYRIFEKDKKLLQDSVFGGLDLVYCWEKGLHCEPLEGAGSLLGFIPPAMIGPPEKTYYTEVTDIPGLIVNEYGKGKTAFFSFRIGSLYHHTRHYGHSALVMSALTRLLDYEPDVETSASPLIELSRQKSKDGNFEWFALLNHSGQLGNAFHKPVPVRDIKIRFHPENNIQTVKRLSDGKAISFHAVEANAIEITVPDINSFDIILVEY